MATASSEGKADASNGGRADAGGDDPTPKLLKLIMATDQSLQTQESSFANEGGTAARNPLHGSDPRLHRNVSNQSTIDSGLSKNSHLDLADPGVRRMFGVGSGGAERQRRLRLLMDQVRTILLYVFIFASHHVII